MRYFHGTLERYGRCWLYKFVFSPLKCVRITILHTMGLCCHFRARLVVRNSSTLVKAAESNKRIMTKKGETKVFMNKKDESCYHVVTMSYIFLLLEKNLHMYVHTFVFRWNTVQKTQLHHLGTKNSYMSSSQNIRLRRNSQFCNFDLEISWE